MLDIETASMKDLLDEFNAMRQLHGKKVVKAGSYNRHQMITYIRKCDEAADKEPVAGEFSHCPSCKIHLSNGWTAHDHEVNGELPGITHEFQCLACLHEFGDSVLPVGDTFTMKDICSALSIEPKLARARYRNFDNDGVSTKYEFPRSKWDEVAMIISPKRK